MAAYAYLLERWSAREAAPNAESLPAPTFDELGSDAWKRKFAATMGTTPLELCKMGATRRREVEARKTATRGRKRVFEDFGQISRLAENASDDEEDLFFICS